MTEWEKGDRGIADQDEERHAALGPVGLGAANVQVPCLRAAELKPVKNLFARFRIFKPHLHAGDAAFAQLRQSRAVVRRSQHDQVGQ